jgi:sarcosine oxidase
MSAACRQRAVRRRVAHLRHAHDDPRLAVFAREARGVWRDWEERFGQELVSRDGAVAIGPVAERRLAVLRQVGGVRARLIGCLELAERLPLVARGTARR